MKEPAMEIKEFHIVKLQKRGAVVIVWSFTYWLPDCDGVPSAIERATSG